MVRYVESRFDQEYTETLGVNFLEKTISLPQTDVTLSIWDLGGSFASMLPMVCVDAVAVCFIFDLTSLPSLSSIKDWYKQVRGLNKSALPFLVGTKFDLFVNLSAEVQASTIEQARKYAKAMKAPLVFCSSSHGINILKLFKLIFEKVFDLPLDVEQRHANGEPLLEY